MLTFDVMMSSRRAVKARAVAGRLGTHESAGLDPGHARRRRRRRRGCPGRGARGAPGPGASRRDVAGEVRTRWTAGASRLVAVRVGLEGALLGHADVVGLLVGEDREVDAERREVERGDLLVE